MQPILRIGLDIDLQRQAELVELVDVGRADIVGERREDVADGDPQGLRPGAIDGQCDMRRVGA